MKYTTQDFYTLIGFPKQEVDFILQLVNNLNFNLEDVIYKVRMEFQESEITVDKIIYIILQQWQEQVEGEFMFYLEGSKTRVIIDNKEVKLPEATLNIRQGVFEWD